MSFLLLKSGKKNIVNVNYYSFGYLYTQNTQVKSVVNKILFYFLSFMMMKKHICVWSLLFFNIHLKNLFRRWYIVNNQRFGHSSLIATISIFLTNKFSNSRITNFFSDLQILNLSTIEHFVINFDRVMYM